MCIVVGRIAGFVRAAGRAQHLQAQVEDRPRSSAGRTSSTVALPAPRSAVIPDVPLVPGQRRRVGQRGDLVDHDPELGGVVGRRVEGRSQPGLERAAARRRPARRAARSSCSRCRRCARTVTVAAHDVAIRDRLEHRALGPGRRRHDDVAVVAAKRRDHRRARGSPASRHRTTDRSARWSCASARPSRAATRRSRAARTAATEAGRARRRDRRPARRGRTRGRARPARSRSAASSIRCSGTCPACTPSSRSCTE